MIYVLWSLLLIVQSASSTWVSRARNSSSLGYHAIATTSSNGIWFASQFILIGVVAKDIKSISEGLFLGAVYTASTVVGSVSMHFVSMKYLERGKRRVGHD